MVTRDLAYQLVNLIRINKKASNWEKILAQYTSKTGSWHSFLVIKAILTGTRWNLKVVLICISLILSELEHSACLWAIGISSREQFSFLLPLPLYQTDLLLLLSCFEFFIDV